MNPQETNLQEMLRKLIREEILQLTSPAGGGVPAGGAATEAPAPQAATPAAQPRQPMQQAPVQQPGMQLQAAGGQPATAEQAGDVLLASAAPTGSGGNGANGLRQPATAAAGTNPAMLEKRLRSNLQQLKQVISETEEIAKKMEQLLAQFPQPSSKAGGRPGSRQNTRGSQGSE